MSTHSFHIPVMGIGFTADTPIKVSHLGIDSVISLVDDILLEKLRKFYCDKFEQSYQEISDSIEDFRAKRITSYLNLVNAIVKKNFQELKDTTNGISNNLKHYFDILPETSNLKKQFNEFLAKGIDKKELDKFLDAYLKMGSIDVNIMTKVDKDNYLNKEQLPTKYNDAHAALRGYAESDLESSVILSAGMNPRLYSYIEEFEDFFPDDSGYLKKKIVLKVSDYRSALIQGKFLAKKGIWISEYRIESGLNCGGHAFATDGSLMGPILAEFRDNREALIEQTFDIYKKALLNKDVAIPESALPVKFTAQGGVGTAEEHEFLLDHYNLDSIGWGSPFLLVPEATTVDNDTLEQLVKAKEEDLYLSDISPLGVPFNNLKGNTKDEEKFKNIEKGRPGSSCPKKFVALNNEFKDEGLCTASRQYQFEKIKELDAQDLSEEAYQKAYDKIVVKSCTCVGLGTSALLKYNLDTKREGEGVSICPGPNLAYYSKVFSLKELVGHIYGENNVITRIDRPNMFIKELTIYVNYLRDKMQEAEEYMDAKQKKVNTRMLKNLRSSIAYYKELLNSCKEAFKSSKIKMLDELSASEGLLNEMELELEVAKAL